jgi:type I restriction enzyme S subunit
MNWPRSHLADHCEVITKGTTPTTLGFDFSDSGIPFLRVQNVDSGRVNFDRDTLFINEKTHSALERSQIRPGDVLVSIAGTIGRAGVVPDIAPALNCNQALAIVRTKNGIFRPFLRHWLESADAQTQMRGATVTGTISNLSLTQVGNLNVPLPPLPEQRRIAEVLDRAEALRAKRRAALAQLDTLTQSIFLDLFGDPATNPKGWPVGQIGELVESASYGTSEKSGPAGQFPVLRMNNITRAGEMDLADLKFMDLPAAQHERYLVRVGDVLFNRTNSAELVGKTAIVLDPKPMAFAGYLVRLRVDNRNDPEYLAAFLNTAYAKKMLRGMCKSIIGMANINATEIQKMKIPKPPLDRQRVFTRYLGAVRVLRASHRASLAKLDALFASLQHRAFRGEL